MLPSTLESYARLVGPLFGSESVRLACSPSLFYLGGVLQRIGFGQSQTTGLMGTNDNDQVIEEPDELKVHVRF